MPAAGLVLGGADSPSALLLSGSPLRSAPGSSAGTRTPLGQGFGKSSAKGQDWSAQPPFLRLPLEPHLWLPRLSLPSLSDPPGATACRFLERGTHCRLRCSGSAEGLVYTLSPQPRCVEPPRGPVGTSRRRAWGSHLHTQCPHTALHGGHRPARRVSGSSTFCPGRQPWGSCSRDRKPHCSFEIQLTEVQGGEGAWLVSQVPVPPVSSSDPEGGFLCPEE